MNQNFISKKELTDVTYYLELAINEDYSTPALKPARKIFPDAPSNRMFVSFKKDIAKFMSRIGVLVLINNIHSDDEYEDYICEFKNKEFLFSIYKELKYECESMSKYDQLPITKILINIAAFNWC